MFSFFENLYYARHILWELIKRDHAEQNKGSYLGLLWNYIQPILYILVLYGVFTLGFRSSVESDIPFGVYLVTGMLSWTYFSNNISSMTGVIKSHRYLIDKIDFRLSMLPLVKLVSSLMPHFVLLILTIALAHANGFSPSWHLVQLLYYYIAMVVLLSGLAWLTSSLSVFIKDTENVVGFLCQLGFWLAPVVWKLEAMPEEVHAYLKLNPAYYIVSGYRDSILSNGVFWDNPNDAFVFWCITLTVLVVGVVVFKKLRPHFAEVM